MFRSSRIAASRLCRARREWVANYTRLPGSSRFPSRCMGTPLAEYACGGSMPRGASAAILVAGLLVAGCDRLDTPIHAREDGAVGTMGTARAGSVTRVLQAEAPPEFVNREREGIRLWDLTKQFYQKRGDAPAWIDNGRPRPAMNELLTALQAVDRDGVDPALYGAAALSARSVEAGHGLFSGRGFDDEESADLDVWMTYLYLRAASDLSGGIAGLSHADPTWQIR